MVNFDLGTHKDPYVAHNFDHNIKLVFPFENGYPIGYPYARSALEGPEEPARKSRSRTEKRLPLILA